jgi:glycosyltransferase involved in cell wall biosynthesis
MPKTMKVFFVIPQAHYSGAAKQLYLLAVGLPQERFEVRVCALGKNGFFGEIFQRSERQFEALGWTRILNLQPLWQLRRLVRAFDPDLIHGWGLSTLPIIQVVGNGRRIFLSNPIPSGKRKPHFDRMTRWLVDRVERILVDTPSEGRLCRRLGLAADKIKWVPAGVEPHPVLDIDRVSLLRSLSIPPFAQILLCIGPLEPHKGFRDGIWALDILKYLFDRLHLVLIGDGSDRSRLEAFSHSIGLSDRVHFIGIQKEIAPWLGVADIVWIPSLTGGGINTALEAMAAAKPVAASQLSTLVDILGDSACYFSPGDKVGLARQTRILLEDAGIRQGMGEEFRRRALAQFSTSALIDRYTSLLTSKNFHPSQTAAT